MYTKYFFEVDMNNSTSDIEILEDMAVKKKTKYLIILNKKIIKKKAPNGIQNKAKISKKDR